MSANEENTRMLELAAKWREGTITEEEQKEFDLWYNSFDDTELHADSNDTSEVLKSRLYSSIKENREFAAVKIKKFLWQKITIAASVLLFLSFGGYLLVKNSNTQQVAIKKPGNLIPIVPGGNKAILTLTDGSKVVLDDAVKGKIAEQAGVNISKTADGQVMYSFSNESGKNLITTTAYNTIETPKGGQYQLSLPDGSKVWLNSGSSLRFPIAFTGHDRSVVLTGEAYFEIAKSHKPFKVSVHNMKVEVLGTHFNIMSYQDEDFVKTTLLEGAVKIVKGSSGSLLKPGQQARTGRDMNDKIIIDEVDTEDIVAWKTGYFMFNNEDVKSIMRKVSRWYDVEIIYQGDVSNKALWGTISRYQNVSEVLKMLELTGTVHFKIQGRRIIVMP